MSHARSHAGSRGARLRLILIIALVLVALILLAGSGHWLTVDSLRTHRDTLMQLVDGRFWESLFMMAALTVALVAASMPVTPVLMLLSGMLFNRWAGSTVMLLSLTAGSTLGLLAVRYLAQDFVRTRVHRYPRARALLRTVGQHQSSYLLFLRVAPGIPFWLTTMLYALTGITALRFLLLTLVGLVPDVVIYCNVGANLAHVKSAHELLSPGDIVALGALALLCLSPVLVQQLRRRGVLHRVWPFAAGRKTGKAGH